MQVYVVADGMGGHSAGEVASRLAVESLVSFIRRSHDDTDLSWPYGIDPTLSLHANRLRTAVNLANRRVFRAAESHDDYTGMGTTVVAALIAGSRMVVASVGDSRLYLLADDTLSQVTEDDTWAATMLKDAREVNPHAFANHPMRHVLTNVLGAREQTDVHIHDLPLVGGERVLLCSDGLYGSVDDDALGKALGQAGTVEEAAERLVHLALERGTRDNVTALVIQYEDQG